MLKLQLRALVSLGLLACLLCCAARARARHEPTSDRPVKFSAPSPAPPATPVSPGDVLISEFRLDGPGGVSDEFVELYNNTDQPITVGATDNSAGWAVGLALTCTICDPMEPPPYDPVTSYFIIPNGTTIPARGHLLWTNTYTSSNGVYQGYSLKDYGGTNRGAGDLSGSFYSFIEGGTDDQFDGLALFTSTNKNNWSLANRLDAVGGIYNSNNNAYPLFVEGTGIQQYGDYLPTAQYSWVRRMETGGPQDTNNNANDFVLVSPQGSFFAAANNQTISTILGAPGPENAQSPIQRNAQIKASLIEPQQASTAAPNRVRDATTNVCGGPNCALGTLEIRRRLKNNTGAPVTALRFRIIDITTLHTPNPGGAQADLRFLTSTDLPLTTSLGNLTLRGTIIEQPPNQPSGGGLNSSAVVNLPGAIGPGVTVDVRLLLGVQTDGRFRFFVNVETLSGAAELQQGKETRAGKLSSN